MLKTCSGSSQSPDRLTARVSTRWWTVLALALMTLAATGCYNNNTGETSIGGAINFKLPAFPESGAHQVVIFSEMHYQPSFKSQEGPRLLPPSDSVPVTGKELSYSDMEEYRQLSVPQHIATNRDASISEGEKLFTINCVVCHGVNLDGQGKINDFEYSGPRPRNLLLGSALDATDGEVFGWISFGGQPGLAAGLRGLPSPTWMPAFNKLLTEDERWKVVMYLRSKQGR